MPFSLSDVCEIHGSRFESPQMPLLHHGGIPIDFEKRRKRGVKQFFDELASNSRIEDSERVLKVDIFYRTIDVALTRIEARFKEMQMVAEKFDFLFSRNLVK